jgi:trk system potassium uptake protein TrkH
MCTSAYCNAGLDITGFITPNASCAAFNNDFFSLTVIALLSFIGGLGFVVIIDIYNYFKNRHRNFSLSLQTKIVLRSSVFLIIIGSLIFFFLEGNNTMKDFSIVKKMFVSFFHSSSQRTSGFTAVEINGQHNLTKFITMCFMLIGASPASTGGGIKTVTVVVIVCAVLNTIRGREDNIIYGKKISSSITYKAITMAAMFIFCILVGVAMIYVLDFDKNLSTIDIFYEVVSCISTTGYTSGISPILTSASKLVLMSLMFLGRIGPISIIISIMENNKNQKNVVLPEEKVILS